MTVGNKTTVFWFDGYEETYTSGSLSEAVRSYFVGGNKIAQTSSVNGLAYLYGDQLGSTAKVKDSTGTVTARYYEPFGKLAATDDGKVRQLFTGQEWDSSSDLFYYNARYYSASLGRFVQPDIVLDGLNRYAYCGNDPVNYSDPTGMFDYSPAPGVTVSSTNGVTGPGYHSGPGPSYHGPGESTNGQTIHIDNVDPENSKNYTKVTIGPGGIDVNMHNANAMQSDLPYGGGTNVGAPDTTPDGVPGSTGPHPSGPGKVLDAIAKVVPENANATNSIAAFSSGNWPMGLAYWGGVVLDGVNFLLLWELGGSLALGDAAQVIDVAADTTAELSPQALKSIKSLEQRIAEHERKLADFKANPTIRPGMETLSQEAIEAQQAKRVQHLETEINTFKNNIQKILRGDL